MTEDIIEAIDNALDDFAVSGDAMRWTPEPADDREYPWPDVMPPTTTYSTGSIAFAGDDVVHVALWTADAGRPMVRDGGFVVSEVDWSHNTPVIFDDWTWEPAPRTAAPSAAELVASIEFRPQFHAFIEATKAAASAMTKLAERMGLLDPSPPRNGPAPLCIDGHEYTRRRRRR